jgi:hypothetical protein
MNRTGSFVTNTPFPNFTNNTPFHTQETYRLVCELDAFNPFHG